MQAEKLLYCYFIAFTELFLIELTKIFEFGLITIFGNQTEILRKNQINQESIKL